MAFKPIAIASVALVLSGAGALALTTLGSTADVGAEAGGSTLERVDWRGHRGQRGGGQRRAMMRTLVREADTNGDRALTQDEIDAFVAEKVESGDADGDGNLSLEEFDTVYRDLTRSRMVDAFQRLDEDGSGIITAAELDERFGNIVATFDRNDDGQLDRADRRRGRFGRGRRGDDN